MDIDLIELWAHMNDLVRGVVVVLTLQALFCTYVVVDRILLVFTSAARSRRFAAEAGAKLEANDYEAVLEIAKRHERSHLASFIHTGLDTFLARRREGHSREKAAELAKRALERKGENLSESLARGLNVLASTGSTAPFIGLLGTVLGILNAFRLIGEEASGGMGTIGPAISEALIVTGYGLLVAIPSVLLFNWLSGQIAKYEAGLANAGSELIDALEAGTGTRTVESDDDGVSEQALPTRSAA
jgi:biopolymer transport protein ExbB/biopolymer transport protein TolQ